jgi:hypothetical protein
VQEKAPAKPFNWRENWRDAVPGIVAVLIIIMLVVELVRKPLGAPDPKPKPEPKKTEVLPVSWSEPKPEIKTVYVPVYVQSKTPYREEPAPVEVKTGDVTNGSVIVGNNNRVTIYGGRDRPSKSQEQEVPYEVPVVKPHYVRPTTPGCDEALKKHQTKVAAWKSGHL